MAALEDLTPGASVRGILPDALVTVVSVQWFGSEALELTYKTPTGKVANEIALPPRRGRLEIVEQGRPWSFDGDGALFRLVSEAQRIRLAHLFDPVLAVHTSLVDPLPHQITAVYEAMLPRQPLRFLLADDPGAGKTIMAGLLIKELIARGDLQRCLIVCPGSLAEQWQDELYRRFHLPFEILTNDKLEAARTGNWFLENEPRHRPARQALAQRGRAAEAPGARLPLGPRRLRRGAQDVGHRSSAARSSTPSATGSGQLLSTLTRHFLLMTATPHNGKEEDFQLFMALLDGDRFEGRFRDGVHAADVSDLMRRMVKENLLKFDGTPLFPERIAYTVPYKLSDAEAAALQGGHRLRARGVQPRRGAGERQARRHGRLRAHHPAAAARLVARGDLPVAAPPPRAAGEPAARAGSCSSAAARSRRVSPPAVPALDDEDVEDLEDAPDNEVEAAEEEILDQATAARTIAELKAEIETLQRLARSFAALCRDLLRQTKFRSAPRRQLG